MEKIQIAEYGAGFQFAGSKATADAAAIAERLGFRPLPLRMCTDAPGLAGKLRRQAGYAKDWRRIGKEVPPDPLVLLQHPFHYPQLTREKTLRRLKARGARFLCLVHDVEELRGYRYSDYYRDEFQLMMELADAFIVHNPVMGRFFLERGAGRRPVVPLGLFDYLQEEEPKGPPSFSRRVIVAGNLDPEKSGYLKELAGFSGTEFLLYGMKPDPAIISSSNVEYGGLFPADRPARALQTGLGLVWDGDSGNGCQGPSGEYLRYNDPHKLSLYLSCGLPVVVWEEAATADLVREKGVGICVASLGEMEERVAALTEAEYRKMAALAWETGKELRSGACLTRAVGEAIERL